MDRFLPAFRTKIWLTTAVTAVGYLLIRLWFPLPPYFNRVPQLDLRAFSPSLSAGFGYGLLLLILFGVYWQTFQWARQHMVAPAFIVGSTLFFGLLLLNSYPINATDVYRYVIRGRVAAVYGQSQFVVPPDAFPNDRFAHFAGEWSGETSPYGPVWEGIATAVAAVSQDN
ncbi:MAG: hypothetical protein KC419_08765, partial [Anaerolineales bacterium]|nr:hypothetical protein [Anaerolineales bacterium]